METVELARDAALPLFAFTDEHRALREVLKMLFADADEPATGWRRLLCEVGADEIMLGAAVPEASDASPVDLAILAEEAGAALFGGPLVPTVLAGALMAGRDDAGLISALRGGSHTVGATVCLAGPVWNGVGANWILVQEVRHGVPMVALLDAADPKVAVEALAGLDPSRLLARCTAGGAAPVVLLEGESATALHTATERTVSLMLSAELLGVAQYALDGTVEYVSHRVQFGRTIGSFQAVKHRLVDLVAMVELARSAVYGAAFGLTSNPGTVSTDIDLAVAAVLSREAARAVTKAAIQLHGGIAITWEHWAHRYFRRANAVIALTGSPGRYRQQLADLVDLRDGVHV